MPTNAETTDTNKPSRDDKSGKDDEGATLLKRKSSSRGSGGSSSHRRHSSDKRSSTSSPSKQGRRSVSVSTRSSGRSASERSNRPSDSEIKEKEKRRMEESNRVAKEALLSPSSSRRSSSGRSSRPSDSEIKEREKRTSKEALLSPGSSPGSSSGRSSRLSDSDTKEKERLRSSSQAFSSPGATSVRSSRDQERPRTLISRLEPGLPRHPLLLLERVMRTVLQETDPRRKHTKGKAPPSHPGAQKLDNPDMNIPEALEAEAAPDVQELLQDALRKQRDEWRQERMRDRYNKKYLFAGACCCVLLLGGAVAAVIVTVAKETQADMISSPSDNDCLAVASGVVPPVYNESDSTTVGVELEFAVASDDINLAMLENLLETDLELKMRQNVLPALIGCPSDLTFNSDVDIVAVTLNTISNTGLAECTQDSDKLCTTIYFEMDVYAKDPNEPSDGGQAVVDIVGEFFQNEGVPDLLELSTAVEDAYFNYAVEIVPSEYPSSSPTFSNGDLTPSASPSSPTFSNENSTLSDNCLAIANGEEIKGLGAGDTALQEYNVLLDVTLDDEISDLSPVTMELEQTIQQVLMPPLAGCPTEEGGLHEETNVLNALVDDVKHDANGSCLEESKRPCYRYDIQLDLTVPNLLKSNDFSREIMAKFEEAPLVEQLGLMLPFVQITFVQIVVPTTSPSASPSHSPTFAPVTFPTTKAPTRTPSRLPSKVPTDMPSKSPSVGPTSRATLALTPPPTPPPTVAPVVEPTLPPTLSPTPVPSPPPTRSPSISPSENPTVRPSAQPVPSLTPSIGLTPIPSSLPSKLPSQQPSPRPSAAASSSPTQTCFQDNTALANAGQNWDNFYTVLEYGLVGDWCFGPAVTSMRYLFWGQSTFNRDISRWDVSGITDMSYMFYDTQSFNKDISSWDVSSVTTMEGMFWNAYAFNQDISGWDVSSVTDMGFVFWNARAFDQDINNWDVSSVTRMQGMFSRNSAFNQDIGNWNVSSVTNMQGMFWNVDAFNQDLSNWDVSSVTNMGTMFYQASAFNQDLSSWDVSSVTNMQSMFQYASAFNQNLCAWGPRIPNSANVASMFGNTDCPSTSNPNLAASPRGPFCHVCS